MTDEDIDRLVAENIAEQNGGCCGGPDWRGHLCQYHQGYESGLDRARTFMENGK